MNEKKSAMLSTISKLPKIILFCLEGLKETFFLAVVGLDFDFVLFFAINPFAMGLIYKFTLLYRVLDVITSIWVYR